ncbi:MAG: prepilin peptidase [Candidatus Levybacteria bacterium]|nr:prepilin peptidase [Candidatus Levybacteria bacterium]
MEVLFFLLVFAVGAAVGSFLNVLIDRLPRGESILFKKSHCANCGRILHLQELVPILSYLWLRGKCKYCKAKISIRLLIVEIATALLFLSIFAFYYFAKISFSDAIFLALVLSSFLCIFFSDLEYGIIPDEVVIFLLGVITLYTFFAVPAEITNRFFASLATTGSFLFLFIITRGRGIGFGDVKLSPVLGLFLGFPKIIIGVYAAFLTGAAVSLILIAMGKKKFKNDTIPFGPFLAIGAILGYFFGIRILDLFL